MSASFSICPRAEGQSRPSSPPPPSSAKLPQLPPLPLAPVQTPSPLPAPTSRSTKLVVPPEHFIHRPQAHASVDNALRNDITGPGNAYEYSHTRLPQITNSGNVNSGYLTTLPPPSLPLPSVVSSPQPLKLTPQPQILPRSSPTALAAGNSQRLSSSQSVPSRSLSGSNTAGVSPAPGRTLLPSSRRSSKILLPPLASHSRKGSRGHTRFTPATDGRKGAKMKTNPATSKCDAGSGYAKQALKLKPALLPFNPSTQVGTAATKATPAATPPKSRRVRTGCLTCRERHLKCDEGAPDCLNCLKGNRPCKRGLRLNFIDIQSKPIPFIPEAAFWRVAFFDESRLIADEYAGGLARYPKVKDGAELISPDAATTTCAAKQAKRPSHAQLPRPSDVHGSTDDISQPPLMSAYQTSVASQQGTQLDLDNHLPKNHSVYKSQHPTQNSIPTASPEILGGNLIALQSGCGINDEKRDGQRDSPGSETSSIASSMVPQGVSPSVASFQADVGSSPTSVDPECDPRVRGGNSDLSNGTRPDGLPTPPSERMGLLRGSGAVVGFGIPSGFEDSAGNNRGSNSGGRDYLNSADEVLYMQVFIEEVGVWMDSLDKDKHFSRIVPYMALKSPMILNASLACGAKHLTLVDKAYQDDKALYYYNTATTQLSLSLKNPDRDIVECATTTVILNVYDTMCEKSSDQTEHIKGARASILDCGWNAKSKGIGAACFWLNVEMEVLSCLESNWATAWDPDHWGLDREFTHAVDDDSQTDACHISGSKSYGTRTKNRAQFSSIASEFREPLATVSDIESSITGGDDEETWVHRILYIVAKIANFRAGVPCFQPSPHDEQVRLQDRFSEWKRLKGLCDMWNRDCPRSMRPFSYLLPSESNAPASLFPNIWLIKQTAVIGRLFYHTAMVLLHQVNPVEPFDTAENLNAQYHHAHQVCGIVAHTKDHGVANVAIRSLAISGLILTDDREQNEVFALLKKISTETGWRIETTYAKLRQVWGRDMRDTDAALPPMVTLATSSLPPPSDPYAAGMFSSNFGFTSNPGALSYSMTMSSHRGLVSHASLSATANQHHLPEPSCGTFLSRPYHLRMYSAASIISNASLTGAATAGSSTHSSPMSAATAYRPETRNPLIHADFRSPDHPYKPFYKRPNDSAQSL